MYVRKSIIPYTILIAWLAVFVVGEVAAQPKFILKRTRKETTPVFVQIMGGFNGESNPADYFQDRVSPVSENAWGGMMAMLQVGVAVDTLLDRPLWVGAEVYYHRVLSRELKYESSVYYTGEPDSRVQEIETLQALGMQLFAGYNIVERFQVLVGAGGKYMYASSDIPTAVEGLLETYFVPTVSVGGKYIMFSYEHGSIDVNVRAMQGFGDYASFEVQSLLGFNFRF